MIYWLQKWEHESSNQIVWEVVENESNLASWCLYQDIKSWDNKRCMGQVQGRVPREWKNNEDESFEFEKIIWSNQNEGV